MYPSLVLGSAVALLSGSAIAADHPDSVSNRGQITVQYGNDSSTLGCLDSNFAWVNDGNCENFRGLFSYSPYYKDWDLIIQNAAAEDCGGTDVMTCKSDNSSNTAVFSSDEPSKPVSLARMYARGVIDTSNPCSVADIHYDPFVTVKAVKVKLIYTPEDPGTTATKKSTIPRRRSVDGGKKRAPLPTAKPTLSSDADTCTGTQTTVSGSVTATQLPRPTPSFGAFQSNTGYVAVSKGGKEAGCLNSDGLWTATQNDCVAYEAKWVEDNSRVELVSKDVNGWCRFRNDELNCDKYRKYTYLTFLVDGRYLVNPSSAHIVPVASDQTWNTTFSAADLPSGGNAVPVHKRNGGTAVKLGWNKID